MVHIVGVDKHDRRLMFSWQTGSDPGWELKIAADYRSIIARISPPMAVPRNNGLRDRPALDGNPVSSHLYFQDIALPGEACKLSVARVLDDERHLVLFGCARARVSPGPGTAEMTALSRLRRHLVSAVEATMAIRDQAERACAGDAILAALPRPVVLIDDARRIRFCNASARQWMADGELIEDDHGLLGLASARDDKALAHEVERMALEAVGPQTGAQRFVLRVGRTYGSSDCVLIGLRMQPGTTLKAFGSEPRTILILHPLHDDASPDPFIIGQAFGLTAAEADVAAAIARGESPKEISRRRAVSLNTVRAQTRAIYEKLNVARQSELTWMLARLPLPALTRPVAVANIGVTPLTGRQP
ncbi:MAG: LuxR C-terminal-related transcriptional regulator [Burkholderiaceae bacterium]